MWHIIAHTHPHTHARHTLSGGGLTASCFSLFSKTGNKQADRNAAVIRLWFTALFADSLSLVSYCCFVLPQAVPVLTKPALESETTNKKSSYYRVCTCLWGLFFNCHGLHTSAACLVGFGWCGFVLLLLLHKEYLSTLDLVISIKWTQHLVWPQHRYNIDMLPRPNSSLPKW